jgi:hypothetical protein
MLKHTTRLHSTSLCFAKASRNVIWLSPGCQDHPDLFLVSQKLAHRGSDCGRCPEAEVELVFADDDFGFAVAHFPHLWPAWLWIAMNFFGWQEILS